MPRTPSPLRPLLTGLAVVSAAAMVLSGCTAPADEPDADGIRVVASTTVYAAIAEQLAGDRASVTAIIDNPLQDPHSYEATARDQLAVASADLIIANGGGYDSFMELLRTGLETSPRVIHAVDFFAGDHGEEEHADHDHDDADHDHDGEARDHGDEEDHADHDHADFNEHVWFSFDTVEAMARAITLQLEALDPTGAEEFVANLADFEEQLSVLRTRAAALSAANEGRSVAITEPVAEYLIAELGLEDRTPSAFPTAIEHGMPVPPATLLEVLVLVEGGQLALLVVNSQTTSPETDQLAAAAEQAGLPILELPETLPQGTGYFEWVSGILDEAEVALQR